MYVHLLPLRDHRNHHLIIFFFSILSLNPFFSQHLNGLQWCNSTLNENIEEEKKIAKRKKIKKSESHSEMIFFSS